MWRGVVTVGYCVCPRRQDNFFSAARSHSSLNSSASVHNEVRLYCCVLPPGFRSNRQVQNCLFQIKFFLNKTTFNCCSNWGFFISYFILPFSHLFVFEFNLVHNFWYFIFNIFPISPIFLKFTFSSSILHFLSSSSFNT